MEHELTQRPFASDEPAPRLSRETLEGLCLPVSGADNGSKRSGPRKGHRLHCGRCVFRGRALLV
jgi:hypothetical protein